MTTLRTILLAAAMVAAAVTPALAQDASPMPVDALDLCTLLPVEEAAAIPPGVAFDSAQSDYGTCGYQTGVATTDAGSMVVGLEEGDAGMLAGIIGGEETTIAGQPAWAGSLGAFVQLGSRYLSVTGFLMSVEDPTAYWTAVAEAIVPRIPPEAWGPPPEDRSGYGPVCPLLDGPTVGAILGVEIGNVEGDDTGCTYTTPGESLMSDDFVTVNVRYDDGALDFVKLAFSDGEDLEVDGQAAYWSPSITALWVDRDGASTRTVQFVLSSTDAATREHAIELVQALVANGG